MKPKKKHLSNAAYIKMKSYLESKAKDGKISLGDVTVVLDKFGSKPSPKQVDMMNAEKDTFFKYKSSQKPKAKIADKIVQKMKETTTSGQSISIAKTGESLLHPILHLKVPKNKNKKPSIGIPSPIDLLEALTANPSLTTWATSVLKHAALHLKGVGIENLTHFSSKYDGDEPMSDKECRSAASVLLNKLRSEMPVTNSNCLYFSLKHASLYLEDKLDTTKDYTCFTKKFFEMEEDDVLIKPEISIQLGMLGGKDGPLSKKEMHPENIDPPLAMVKCCNGEGEHEFLEGEPTDCNCIACECGCIVNSDENTYKCTNCEQCEVCCEHGDECYSCDQCGTTVDKIYSCDNCNKCDSCCSKKGDCWTCSGCGEPYSIQIESPCANCDRCSHCCGCPYCEYHETYHSSNKEMCGDCDSCLENCSCSECKDCGADKEEMDSDQELCSKCHYCSNCGCHCHKSKIKTASLILSYVPKTQKAKGLYALRRYLSEENVPEFVLGKADDKNIPYKLVNRFVRPCPTKPRHGFVDSRYISSAEEATKIVEETLKADSEAEFIIMPKIASKWSGIWTPGLLSIGSGNDGATAGHSSVAIPIEGDLLGNMSAIGRESLLKDAGIETAPYMELLWTEPEGSDTPPNYYVVQLRDGPKLPETENFIPKEVEVKSIITVNKDNAPGLLEWETIMKQQTEGTVVYHPGGTLASHYAVHAVLKHIPVLITREPVIGEKLVPTQDGESKPDTEKIRRGFYYGMTAPTSYKAATYMMLLGVHSTVKWLGKQDLLLGAALGAAYRLTITAAVGEWRHRPTHDSKLKKDRETVYTDTFDRIFKVNNLYMRILRGFRQLVWSEGMGGDQWFQFTQWAALIRNAVLEGDVSKALAAMNNAVNAAHNNGWGFNKFAPVEAMDAVPKNPIEAAKNCGPFMYDIMSMDTAGPEEGADLDGNLVALPTPREKCAAWFAKVKPFNLGKFNQWITQIPVNHMNAEIAQMAIEGEDRVRVEYLLAKNSKCYSTQVIMVDKVKMAAIKKIMEQILPDGRLMGTFAPNEEGVHIDYKTLPIKSEIRKYAPLVRLSMRAWSLYPNTDTEAIPIIFPTTALVHVPKVTSIPAPTSLEQVIEYRTEIDFPVW